MSETDQRQVTAAYYAMVEHIDDSVTAEAKKVGVRALLTKEVSPGRLRATIEQVLRA